MRCGGTGCSGGGGFIPAVRRTVNWAQGAPEVVPARRRGGAGCGYVVGWPGSRMEARGGVEEARQGGDALACSGSVRTVRGAHCSRRYSGGDGFLRAAVWRERGQQGEVERGGPGTGQHGVASPRPQCRPCRGRAGGCPLASFGVPGPISSRSRVR